MLQNVNDNRFESAASALRLPADGLGVASDDRCAWTYFTPQSQITTIEAGLMKRGQGRPFESPP